jgi:hypothetical protein
LPTDAESRASSASMDRALERARAINPDTGFTNSTGAKIKTADAFSNSLRRVREARGQKETILNAQQLAYAVGPNRKRTKGEILALRRQGFKAGKRRKTGRRKI